MGTRGLVRDITEAQRSTDALAAAERRFRALIEKASDAIALLDPDGTLLYDSPAATGLLGYAAGSLLGKSMLTFVHPDDLAQVTSALERLLKAPGATINALFRFQHTDGRWLWFEATGTNMLNEPSVSALVINYRDVTDRVHAQEHLRLNEERYRQLFDSMLDGFALHEIICDPSGEPVDYRFLEVNAAFESLTGLPRENVIGKTALEVLPGLEAAWIERYGAVALTGEPAHFRNFSQELGRHYDVTAYRPRPGQFAVIFEDITDRVQAEVALKSTKHDLEQFFDVVPDLVAIASTDGYFKKLNSAWEEVLGFTGAELMAEPLESFIHPEDVEPTRREVARQLAGGTTANFANRYRTKAGTYRWLEWHATPSPDGSTLNAAARDITDRQQAQEALQRRARELQTLYETSLEVTAQATLGDLLKMIVTRAAAMVGTDMGAVYLVEPDGQAVTLAVAHNLPQSFVGASLRLGEGMSGTVAQTGQPMQVDDYQSWPGRSAVYNAVPIRRVLAIPLKANDEILGVINVADSTSTGSFPDEQVQLVGLFANQAAIAIHARRAQDARRESERQFRELLENAQLVAILLDTAGRVTFCNEYLLRLLGCDWDQVIGQGWFERFVPPELRLDQVYRDAIQRGTLFAHHENEILTAFGSRRLIAWNNTILRDPQGRVIGVASLGEDVTDRRRAEAENTALLEIMRAAASTQGLREFLGLVRQALGRVLDAENFFVVFHHPDTGLFEEVFAVDKFDAPMSPSKLEKSITALVFRTGKPLQLTRADFEELVARGEVEAVGQRPACWIGAPLKTPSETIGVIAVQDYENSERYSVRDLTFLASLASQVALAVQRKEAEDALKGSEARFRGLFEDSPVSLWEQDFSLVKQRLDVLSRDGVRDLAQYLDTHPELVRECAGLVKLLDVNKATLALYGAQRKADLLNDLRRVLEGSALEAFRGVLLRIAAGETRMTWEAINRTLDGKLINIVLDWSAVPGYERSLSRVIVAITDVTARTQAQILQQAVYRIAAAAENAPSLDALYHEIHETISSVMPAENFYITTYDADAGILRFPYYRDVADPLVEDEIPAARGLTAYVLRTRKSLLCTQAVHDELERLGEVELVGSPSEIWLGVPLSVGGRIIGAMVVQHYTDPKAYGEREQHMLEFVSTQIATAIHRKQAEEALRESEGRLQALVASLDDAVIEYDRRGNYLNVWARDEDMLARPAREMVGRNVMDVLGPDKSRPILDAIQRALTSGTTQRLEYELDLAVGPRWFRARLSPIFSTARDSGTVSALIRDVTLTRVAEERLRREVALLENMQDAVVGADNEACLNAWNSGAEALYGWKADEVLGRPMADFLRTEWASQDEDDMRRELDEQGRWRGEVSQVRKDGTRIPVEVSSVVLRDGNGQISGWLSVNHDITPRKHAAEALRAQLEELQRWHAVTLQREDRILDLKRQINEQLTKVGQPPRYASAETQPGQPD